MLHCCKCHTPSIICCILLVILHTPDQHYISLGLYSLLLYDGYASVLPTNCTVFSMLAYALLSKCYILIRLCYMSVDTCYTIPSVCYTFSDICDALCAVYMLCAVCYMLICLFYTLFEDAAFSSLWARQPLVCTILSLEYATHSPLDATYFLVFATCFQLYATYFTLYAIPSLLYAMCSLLCTTHL